MNFLLGRETAYFLGPALSFREGTARWVQKPVINGIITPISRVKIRPSYPFIFGHL